MNNNQQFNARNLKKIYTKLNKKGAYLENKFFPEVDVFTKKMSRCKKLIHRIKTFQKQQDYEARLIRLYKIKDDIYQKREEKINEAMESVAQNINKFQSFNLSKGDMFNSKQTYKISNNAETYLAEKKLQNNISQICDVKPANRNAIIECLSGLLRDQIPKIIIRLDIKSFYESIPHNLLKSHLKKYSLSLVSAQLILRILNEYNDLSNSLNKGLPRGIGSSAYLSEVFMKEIDLEIQQLPYVIYYQRYVDDMIIIFSPEYVCDETLVLDDIVRVLQKYQLQSNPEKEQVISTINTPNFNLEYLGYKFSKNADLTISISNHKVSKYKKKIDAVFDYYMQHSINDKNQRLLINRIRFLTGNTKLSNNKGGAFIGIFYSNKYITDTHCLRGLDFYLNMKINQLTSQTLQKKLQKFSFKEGFEQKIFRYFLPCELSEITRVWK